MSLTETETTYTGNEVTRQTITCPFFDLWPNQDTSFAHEDISIEQFSLGGLFIPLTVRRENHLEAQHTVRTRDLTELKAEAGLAAMRALRRKIGFGDVLVDKWIEYSIIEDEKLYALAVGERILDIAIPEEAYVSQ